MPIIMDGSEAAEAAFEFANDEFIRSQESPDPFYEEPETGTKDKARCQVKLEWAHYEGSEKRGAYPTWSLYVGTVWLATLVDEWDGYWTVSGSVVNIDDTLDHLPSRWDEVDLPQLKEKVEQAMIAELTRC